MEQCPECRLKYSNVHICKMPCCGYIDNDLSKPCGEMVHGNHECPKCHKYLHAYHGYDINDSIKYITCAQCNMVNINDEYQSNNQSEVRDQSSLRSGREQPLPTECKAKLIIIQGPELGNKRKRIGNPVEFSFIANEGKKANCN